MIGTRVLSGTLAGIDRKQWLYPKADQDTLNWWFDSGTIDVDGAIELMRPYMTDWGTCIQAGGAIGVWPLRLAQHFSRVITFEPEPVNWQCLIHNVEGIENIECNNSALWSTAGALVSMELTQRMEGHCGAWHVEPGGDISTTRIDDMDIADVDLIYLDIEGSEYDALLGARNVLENERPVVGLEKRNWGKLYYNAPDPVDLLVDEFDYRVIGKANKDDVMLVPC